MSEQITVNRARFEGMLQEIKDFKYLVNQMSKLLTEKDEEIKYLRSFPAEVINEEAAKILRNKKARVFKRVKDDDEE